MRLDLLQNAYDFLNLSLIQIDVAKTRKSTAWKIALVSAVQGLELLLKELLRKQHRALIRDNVDRADGNTVSLRTALSRLQTVAGVTFSDDQKRVIARAVDLRDRIVHYELVFDEHELETSFALVYHSITNLHLEHFGDELHSHVDPDLWHIEAEVMKLFRDEFVIYNGISVMREWPSEIFAAQSLIVYVIEGEEYRRIPYGAESSWLDVDPGYADIPCHDCAVVKGQLHVPGCDMEQCPRCGGQMLSCECRKQDYYQ